VLVVGANDVVNPSAKTDPDSPIYGMPVLNVDEAATTIVVKRSLSPGFAGIDNPLFYEDHTLMYFADAKKALEERGVEVEYAIHPVAGRMPGHMNVLLAEADIPYDLLLDLDHANPRFSQTDVVLVVGANDVVNPSAKTDPDSPIYGMPVLNVDEAATTIVVKRSLSPGFAGIDNPLFYEDRTLMYFADAKKALEETLAALDRI
jgi:NAD/NADP transhydrogenase beta subunit